MGLLSRMVGSREDKVWAPAEAEFGRQERINWIYAALGTPTRGDFKQLGPLLLSRQLLAWCPPGSSILALPIANVTGIRVGVEPMHFDLRCLQPEGPEPETELRYVLDVPGQGQSATALKGRFVDDLRSALR